MVHASTLTSAAAAALILALPLHAAGLYPKSSAVLQVDAKNYDRLIAKSNHTSIVEFYAPWCGHCKNLQPAYENAARKLSGLAKVAAINCDEDANKQFCGSMGVQGFPTLKIVKPGKTYGRPIVEDYNGPRETKEIVEAVTSKIPNHVKKVTDKDLEAFLADANETAKAILFTEKGTTSALLKAVAVDFLGIIKVAQIRNKEKASVELFGITKFPSLLLLPGGKEAEGTIYEGQLKKDGIVKFLSQVAPPNPDPAPAKVKMPKNKKDKKDKNAEKDDKAAKETFESASSSHASSEGSASAASATAETLEEATKPTESPDPVVTPEAAPVILEEPAPPVPNLDIEALAHTCLGESAGTCVLAFVPKSRGELATQALDSLANIAHKHNQAKRKIFPFYVIADDNVEATAIKQGLGLTGDVEIVAVNRKRGWWRHFEGPEPNTEAVEIWVDAIRMGEGEKQRIPEGIMPQKTPNAAAGEQPLENQKPIEDVPPAEPEATPETTAENVAEEKTPPPTEEASPEAHDEL